MYRKYGWPTWATALTGIPSFMRITVMYFRLTMGKNAWASFSYSIDGIEFTAVENGFQAKPGRWIGAKIGLYCTRTETTNDSGYADFDWFRIEPANGKL